MFALSLSLALAVAVQDIDEVVREYWRFFDSVGIHSGELARTLDRALTPADDAAFQKAQVKLLEILDAASRDVGLSAAALRKGLVEGEAADLVKRIDDVIDKLSAEKRARARDLRLLLLPAVDLKRALDEVAHASPELRTSCAYVCKALLGLFHSELTRQNRLPMKLEQDVEAVVGAKPDELMYARGYLRMASDRVFLRHMTDPEARGPRVSQRRDVPVDAAHAPYLAAAEKIRPGDAAFAGGAVWSAHLRWNVGEDKGNAHLIDQAIAADADNAYFGYLKAYFDFFEGEDDRAIGRIRECNKAKRYDAYSKEILGALASAHEGPLRYFFSIYAGSFPHSIRFYEISNTYIDQQVGKRLEEGKAEEAWALLSDARALLRRAAEGSVVVRERVSMLAALRASLAKQAFAVEKLGRAKEALALQRELVRVERELAAIDTAFAFPAEFEFLAAGLLVDGADVEKRWQRRLAEGFDAPLISAALRRYDEHVTVKVLKGMPEFGGDVEDEDYRAAVKAFEEGRFGECVGACIRVLSSNRAHLHALELKRRALDKMGD